MKFSLIVSTIGREAELRLLFQSLAEQGRDDFEVIVVDQSQAEGTASVVGEFAARFPIRHERMSQRGLSRGRNRGLALATGEIVAFPDDDCTYVPGHLDRVAAVFDGRPELDALTSRAEVMGRNDPTGGPVTRDNILGRCVEFTLFVRRERLGDLRYDEEMGTGAGTPWGADEGPDLMLRMLGQGFSIEYFPELVVYHPDPVASFDEKALRRSYSYSCGRGWLYRKHGFPRRVVAYSLFRSLAGSLLMLATLRFARAKYYWLAFTGKCRGYMRKV